MTIDSKTITLFRETRVKLRELFKINLKGLPTDGHYANPLIIDNMKGVMIENKHGEKVFVPEEQYNRFFERIVHKNDYLQTLDGVKLKTFGVENQFWLGDIAYLLRDYTPAQPKAN